jgi:4-amino-4-deoxy-L-arabinose transferase-like glycosyltransferase
LALIGPAALNPPNPALVTHRAAQRLPRPALLLFCAAYVLPGLFGRDPWKNADITAFGYMLGIAEGRTPWYDPTLGGLPADSALLPYWIGAAFIRALGPWVGPALAARVPFALLLVGALVGVWYATYYLARAESAQPLPFAFGGEAAPVDYARAIADGALLALIASLGLLQLGHETTPELAQLASVTLFLFGLAALPFSAVQARSALVLALPALAASGAPSIATLLGIVGAVLCRLSPNADTRRATLWVCASAVASASVAALLGAWGWRVGRFDAPGQVIGLVRLLVWFTWPAWPLALWTLWRWRERLSSRHIMFPLICAGTALVACIAMGGSDRALMLGLPPLAVLAAFALPTLQRSTAAAIDWFSVFFFSIAAITVWVVYLSIETGVPAKPAANIARLAPGYTPVFSLLALLLAAAGTLAWIWLVHWRTRRTRHPLWKSMVLPASGVSLCWLLVMTLLLAPLDHARSYRSLVERIARHVPRDACVAAPGMPRAPVAALEYLGGYRVDAITPAASTPCRYLLLMETRGHSVPAGPDWRLVSRERRSTNEDEVTTVYRRAGTAVGGS